MDDVAQAKGQLGFVSKAYSAAKKRLPALARDSLFGGRQAAFFRGRGLFLWE
jgi:hypothetical protein